MPDRIANAHKHHARAEAYLAGVWEQTLEGRPVQLESMRAAAGLASAELDAARFALGWNTEMHGPLYVADVDPAAGSQG